MACGSANEPVDYVKDAWAPANSATESHDLKIRVINLYLGGRGPDLWMQTIFLDSMEYAPKSCSALNRGY